MRVATPAAGGPQPEGGRSGPSELMAATKALLDWAAGQGLTWDMSPGEGGERWDSRLEIYQTDPGQEPDMSKWVTQLAFRLAD